VTRPHSGSEAFTGSEPADRRQEILMACIRVVAKRGFVRTRMSDIAEEIGVTAPLLLHYFGSKNELITEALVVSDETYLMEFTEAFRSGERPERLVVKYVEDSVWPAPDARAWWAEASAVWMNAWITALHDPSIARVRAEEDQRWRTALAEVVSKGLGEGAFRSEVEAETLVRTLFALLDGFMVQLVLDDPGVSRRFAYEESMRFLGRELGFDPYEFSSRPRASAG
jgi:AcrR family transcriptional regulator